MSLYAEIRKIDIAESINGFVQYFKNTEQLVNKTLFVPLRFTANDFDKNKSLCKEIILLFHGVNYITVAWCDDNYKSKLTEANFEACHDSCWRDGTRRIINMIQKEFDEYFNENDDVHVFNSFGIQSIELMDVKLVNNGYEDKMVKVIKAE